METVLVKSIYPVDTISKGNTKAWAKLISYMEGKDTDTMFDFKGIEVVEPWGTAEFKKFIQNPHVFMTLWNNEKAVNSINIMCKLNNIDADKAFNESVPVVKAQPTKEELKVAEQAAALQPYFINDNGVGVLQIYKRFDQIGVPKTVSYIEAALKKYAEDNGVSHLKLEAKNIVVQTSVIESVTELIQKLADVGVELDIDSNDTEVMNKVKMYHSLGKSNVNSDQEKIKQITKMLYPGKVGMLIRYKESKATDEFGRSGKGKPLSCRAAVILGMRKNSEGVWDEDPMANEIQNPMGRLEIKDREINAYVNVHGRLTYTILDGLKLSAFGSYTYNVKENKRYFPKDIKASMADGGHAERVDNKQNILMGNIQLTYTKDFNEKHHFDALALVEGQKYHYTGFTAKSHAYETDYFTYNNLKAGGDVKYGDVESLENENRIASFMARVNYMYDNRYIVTANLRADGSSKLGSENKWGFFPSASLAWVINEEAFMEDVDWLSNLKLRAGYGLTGNQDAIAAYNSLALYQPSGLTSLGGSPMATYAILRNANPDLRWEVKKTFDVGVDFGVMNGRYSLTADWYRSKTSDMLYMYDVPVPPFVYPSLLANMGEMTNTGIELAINAGLVQTKDFDFNLGMNFSWQKNKLNSLSGTYMGQDLSTSEYIPISNMSGAGFVGNNNVVYMMEGQPVGVFYIPRCLGLSEPDENGHRTYILDDMIDGQEGFNSNDGGDRYIAGQAMPKYYLGLNLNFRYKRFDLTTQMNGAFGHKIFNGTSLAYMNLSQFPTYNVMDGAQDEMIFAQDISDYWLESGNYLNIEYITLGYNFNCEKFSEYVKNIRLSFSVNNVATISGYSGLSPMLNSQTISNITDPGANTLGVDNKEFYPLSRTYSLGVSVTF